jgi:hypothetical protein
MPERGNGRANTPDTGFDIRAQHDMGHPDCFEALAKDSYGRDWKEAILTWQICHSAELVHIRNPHHGNDGGDGSERQESERLQLGLPLHLRVPKDNRRHHHESHVGQYRGHSGGVANNHERFHRGTCRFSSQDQYRVPDRAYRLAIQQSADESDEERRPSHCQKAIHGYT